MTEPYVQWVHMYWTLLRPKYSLKSATEGIFAHFWPGCLYSTLNCTDQLNLEQFRNALLVLVFDNEYQMLKWMNATTKYSNIKMSQANTQF